ncbi:carbohydrate esterase family 9 protein-like protein [Tricladium varicosporioides]|nr:carbohydrate esterase family 9 protein-like protein [Hymenoscyphus varicosporioides]
MEKSMLSPQPPIHTRRQYRPKVSLSFLTIVLLILALQFLVLPNYISKQLQSQISLSNFHSERLDAELKKCAGYNTPPVSYPVTHAGSRANSRWNEKTGQQGTIVLRNATLFDGEKFVDGRVDVKLEKGLIVSVTSTNSRSSEIVGKDVMVIELDGGYVTPGLVDMHSHHLSLAWPDLSATDDTNEVNDDTGPLTPQVRIIDSMKAYDPAMMIIASGGVTTSLILPGSANVMGGEAVLVKNLPKAGNTGEEVVEDILLEHGVPESERRRYMKMACGENPRRVYKHTRMGNAWVFRKHMERARELMEKQDEFCLSAAAVRDTGDMEKINQFMATTASKDDSIDYLEYDSSIAMLRGQVGINVHCYETEDFEDMIKHSKEFGFRIQAFHHALDAWEVPELLKSSGENITVATFAEFGFYKKEAYEANLWAGKILAHHGVPVAYKSDHVEVETNAKYLLFQAATAYSFHLPADLALQSVTSVPAKSLQIDHRVGYARPGYDADLVVWDSHPLAIGATALQVFIDGRSTLDPKIVSEAGVRSNAYNQEELPKMRAVVEPKAREDLCKRVEKPGSRITITGIKTSYHKSFSILPSNSNNLTLVLENGKALCFASHIDCLQHIQESTQISLQNGHLLPGLTAVTVALGLTEIQGEKSTSNGVVKTTSSSLDPANVVYAKYGIHLDGRGFGRARIGGATRAVTALHGAGFVDGVSVEIGTSERKGILNGGIKKGEVALHFSVGQGSKDDTLPTVSSGVAKLRQILDENKDIDNIYRRAANGSLPLVVHAENEYDISQLLLLSKSHPSVNLIIYGGSSAHLIAPSLASHNIPVILTSARGAPDTFEKRHALPGPPLSRSPAAILYEAGVKFCLAIAGEGDSHLHNLGVEAGWVWKFAREQGMTGSEAVGLVSSNVRDILKLDEREDEREQGMEDLVVWEGDPLKGGASVVVSFEGGEVGTCWPESN